MRRRRVGATGSEVDSPEGRPSKFHLPLRQDGTMYLLTLVQDAVAAAPTGADMVAAAKNTNALLGAGLALGRIGGSAAEAIARQPEAAGEIRGAALLIAVLLEGATIIALVFALLFK